MNPSRNLNSCLPMAAMLPIGRNGDFGRSPFLGSFANKSGLGSIDIGRLVKDFPMRHALAKNQPAGRPDVSQGSRSKATAAPPFRHGWLPSWTRKKSRNAQSGWFGQRDRFPIATVSAAALGSLRQPRSLHDRSLAETLSHNTAKLARKVALLKIKACLALV
jgi:hypothetical protein